jgi:hypothetical protein
LIIPSGPIRWACEALLKEVKYIGLHGISDFNVDLFLEKIDINSLGLFILNSEVTLYDELDEKFEKAILWEAYNNLKLLNITDNLSQFNCHISNISDLKTKLKLFIQFNLKGFKIMPDVQDESELSLTSGGF